MMKIHRRAFISFAVRVTAPEIGRFSNSKFLRTSNGLYDMPQQLETLLPALSRILSNITT